MGIYLFFHEALPESGELTLPELHSLVRDIWLTRYDEELEEEQRTRRKGRPKSVKEVKLEELKLREAELYRTGMEVPDLTHPPTVTLFRRWDQKEIAFMQLLRFVRISSAQPDVVVLSRPGKHFSVLDDPESSSPSSHSQKSSQAIPLEVDMAGVEIVPPVELSATSNMNLSTPDSARSTPSILREPSSHFGSTIMEMDGPLV